MHGKLLELVFPYEKWVTGESPEESYLQAADPHYEHDPNKLTMKKRGIDTSKLNKLMSNACQQADQKFVGVSLYSPSYVAKTRRLMSPRMRCLPWRPPYPCDCSVIVVEYINIH